MKSRAALVFLGLVLGVLTVSSAVAETSKDVVNGNEAKKVNVRGGGWSGGGGGGSYGGGGQGGNCKYGYCCGRGYHGSYQKCCKSAEEAKLMGTDISKAEEVLDTTYNGGGGGGNYGDGGGNKGGGGENYGGGGGQGGKCKYGYCCGRGYHGSCQKCCKSAEEAKLMGTDISTAEEVLDTTYNGGSGGGNNGDGGGNKGGGGGNYGGGGGQGGKCKYGYCCGRGYHGSCQKCCKTAEEAKLMGTDISTAEEVLDTAYNEGGGGGNYGDGGGNKGGGGGQGGKCKYGYCCGRGYHGSCQKCCKSAEEAKLMGTDISTAEEVLDTTYNGGGGGGNYGDGGGNKGGGGGQGGKCKYGYCCGRGYHGSCQKCCKSAEEAKLMGTDISTAEEVLDTAYNGGGGGGNYGDGGGNKGGGGGNYGGGGGQGGKCKYGYCCGRGYHGSCQKCCKSAEEAKLMGTEATTP